MIRRELELVIKLIIIKKLIFMKTHTYLFECEESEYEVRSLMKVNGLYFLSVADSGVLGIA